LNGARLRAAHSPPSRLLGDSFVTTAPTTAIRRLAVGRAISVTGWEAGWIALMVAVYARTHSTVWMSAALFFTIATAGLVAPIAGALGDRYDRRLVMIAAELTTSVFAVGMVFTRAPALLVALAALGSLAQAPFMPASSASVPNLVGDDRLEWANSTISVGRNVGALLGPLCGGVLAAAVGASAVFAIAAVAALVAAGMVASVSGNFGGRESRAGEHGELRAGFTFVWHSPVLRGMTAAWMVLLFLLGPILVAELPLAHLFGLGAAGYGIIAACWGGGAIVGSFLGRVTARRNESATMIWGCVLIGSGFAVVAGAPVFEVAMLGMIVAGLSEGTVSVAELTIIQRFTPDAVRARVNSATEAAAMCAFALSFPFAGLIINALGVRGAYALAALGCVLAAGILVPTMRAARRPAAVADDRSKDAVAA
jgi:MFS family permease